MTDTESSPPLNITKKKKKARVIGTHDGTFQTDEVMACWLLKQLPEYKDAIVLRTHNRTKLKWCHTVVDIGGIYDPTTFRFDHHQKSFFGTMKSLAGLKWTTKMSSAGLVYLHFGEDVISELACIPKTDPMLYKLYEKLYEDIIEEIDASDNRIEMCEDEQPRYVVTTTLCSRVEGLNPPWNATNPDMDGLFAKAMEVCGGEFMQKLIQLKDVWFPGHKLVLEAVKERFSIHLSGEVLLFRHDRSLLEEHLFEIEEELDIQSEIKFVLSQGKNQYWWLQCIPKSLGSFENRVMLCEKWRGLRHETLSQVSGIPDSVFVHPRGFIGCNRSYNGALEMAKATLAAL